MKSATAIQFLPVLLLLGLGAGTTTQDMMNSWVGTIDPHLLSFGLGRTRSQGQGGRRHQRGDLQGEGEGQALRLVPQDLDDRCRPSGHRRQHHLPSAGRGVKIPHGSLLAAMSLALAALGLGTYLAAVDAAWNSPGSGATVIGRQAYDARDELGRPACRRNNFGDPQRPLVRIGQSCR